MQKKTSKNLNRINGNWSLFLDRDGVINQRILGDYIKTVEEFSFTKNAPQALEILAGLFETIIVVTNQQGIGKGLMSEQQLREVHDHMCAEIEKQNGRIHQVYYCPELEIDKPFCRKPQVGMGLKAKKDFPGINFKKAVMVGDTLNDMIFGKRLGMITVMIHEENTIARQYPGMIDHVYCSLFEFALEMERRCAN